MANQSQDIFKLTCVFETLADRLSPTLLSIHGYPERYSPFVARYHLPIQPSTKHWWFDGSIKKAQLGIFCVTLPVLWRKNYKSVQHILSSSPEEKTTTTTKPHIYTYCTHFRGCIENKNKLVKQTEIVAKCIAIIWWLQQQTNKQTVRALQNPTPPSIQPIFFSIQCCHNEGKAPSFALVLWIDDSCYGTFVDWILTLRNRDE